VRVSRAIDRFLEQMQLERDFTDRSVNSYGSVLYRLCDEPPRGLGIDIQLHELDGREGTDKLREHIARNWGKTSTGRRANVISVHHTFFEWAEEEGFIESDPARKIKRPPRRKADVYRPPTVDQDLGLAATTLYERAAWVLANDLGLRASTIVQTQWRHIDLTQARISVHVKGGPRIRLPISPHCPRSASRRLPRGSNPTQTTTFSPSSITASPVTNRLTYRRDPKRPASTKSLWAMVKRVCKRAGIREFGPHALRHGFASRFLRDSEHDMYALRQLMGHAQMSTTEGYTSELDLEELEEALRKASERRTSVANPGDESEGDSATGIEASSGPGWNRTTGRSAPADQAERPRADADDARPLTDPKGSHKDA